MVSTHSRPKAAACGHAPPVEKAEVSTHSRPKAAGWDFDLYGFDGEVSTHSRPKAADLFGNVLNKPNRFQHTAARRRLQLHAADGRICHRFNTQPPEGGWSRKHGKSHLSECFNTQPPEGGCFGDFLGIHHSRVSTHSRPKAAVPSDWTPAPEDDVSTHSRPKAAVLFDVTQFQCYQFQHTAARRRLNNVNIISSFSSCFNTQPPEGGCR